LAFSNPGLKVQVDYLKSPPTKTRRAKMSHEDREKLSHDGEKGAESLQADFCEFVPRAAGVYMENMEREMRKTAYSKYIARSICQSVKTHRL